ncbi:hypothetical protein Tco_1135699, partial [Tanacetum coccineum]
MARDSLPLGLLLSSSELIVYIPSHQNTRRVKPIGNLCVAGGKESFDGSESEGEYCPLSQSTSYGTLPSQTVTNPRKHVNAITTRSGKTCERPSTPLIPTPVVSTPLKEPEQNLETSIDKVQKPSLENTAQVPPPEDHDSIFIEILKPKAKETVQEPNSPEPDSYQPKLPYTERMKVREKDTPSAQQSRFMKLFKQLRLEISLKDALIEMP